MMGDEMRDDIMGATLACDWLAAARSGRFAVQPRTFAREWALALNRLDWGTLQRACVCKGI